MPAGSGMSGLKADKSTYPVTFKYREQFNQLKELRFQWEPHWEDLQENYYPRKGMYLDNPSEKPDEGWRRDQYIINSIPGEAVDVLAAGLQGGLTSPSRPWFRLGLAVPDLDQNVNVREWLQATRDVLLDIFSRSNFYGAMHNMYEELAAFGTSVMLIERDLENVIRCKPFTIGEYYLGVDTKYRPTTLYRRFAMNARNMVAEYGEKNCSSVVQNAAKDETSTEETFKIIHCIRPRNDRDANRLDSENMEYESIYFQEDTDNDMFLRNSGYRGRPFLSPRWFVRGTSTYGRSPGMTALGDAKQLQKMEKEKLKGLSKSIDPPMNAPSSMKKQGGGTVVPGGVNYVDVTQGMQGFVPSYQIQPDFQGIAFEIDRVEQRIQHTMYNHLFLSIIAQDKQMTATEVTERSAEKLVMLGPVLERLHTEGLSIAIDRTMSIAEEMALLPPPPPEIQGMPIKIEYISLLAQAQKILGLTNIDSFIGFVGNLASVKPEALDAINTDKSIDEYAEGLGVPATMLNDAQERGIIRQQRAQQQQAMQAAAAVDQGAQTAKTLSETDMSGNTDSALSALLGGITAV